MLARVAISGASGHMGRILIEKVYRASGVQLSAALCRAGNVNIGLDAGAFLGLETGIKVTDNLQVALSRVGCDCLIDFTHPQATLRHLAVCVRNKVNMVIGTTGFDEEGKNAIQKASEKISIVFSPNMSVAVNVVFKLLDLAARALDDSYDVEIFEGHHRCKIDAPSGTALKMGEIVAGAWDLSLENTAILARSGNVGSRPEKKIGFSVLRGGDIVGSHTVHFLGTGECIEITHRATNRSSYANGALSAARFLLGKKDGLYDMQSVINLAVK